ncbi:hypothetical protein KJ359_004538 [Pestalotiopsis sp. 9143b]|nr:hypothetical protein KJ359_004538 [Pestalotiopsis sp. 9143b]
MSHFLVSSCVDFINNLTWQDVCREDTILTPKTETSKPISLLYADGLSEAMSDKQQLFTFLKSHVATGKEEFEAAQRNEALRLSDESVQDSNSSSQQEYETNDWTVIHHATMLLSAVNDIRDELGILKFLVAQQQHVWNDLLGQNLDDHDTGVASKIVGELDDMIQTADTILQSVKEIISLDQNSININDSLMSRALVKLTEKSAEQSETLVTLGKSAQEQTKQLVDLGKRADQQSAENYRQGKMLMLFTIVTVVFTPLSFLSSFYALNTTTSRHNDGGDLEYELEWMNERILGISAGIIGPLLIYAFFGEMLQNRVMWSIQCLQVVWGLMKLTGSIGTYKAAMIAMKERLGFKSTRSDDVETGVRHTGNG